MRSRRGRVVRGWCGVWTGGHGWTRCGRYEGVWEHGDGGRRLLFSRDGWGILGWLGEGEADIVFGCEERPEEGDEIVVRDLGEGVVVDDCPRVRVAGVYDPGRGHAEAGPYLAVFCAYADGFEGVAKTGGVWVSAEGGDEHGLDDTQIGDGSGELGEESEYMGGSTTARCEYGLCARDGGRDWMGWEYEGVSEKYGAGCEYAKWRSDGDEGESVPSKTCHDGTTTG